MHDQEKLSRLFDAALQQPEAPRGFAMPAPAASEFGAVAARQPVASAFAIPSQKAGGSAFVFTKPGAFPDPTPVGANVGHDNVSEEFRAIMDEKIAKRRRRNRISYIITLILFFVPTVGGAGWFVSDPSRVSALMTAVSEIKNAGDIKAIVAKYQKSLDKIAVRSKQIDDATLSIGGDPNAVSAKDDLYFDKEMRNMSGADGGPTVSERNARLMKKFGHAKDTGTLMGGPGEAPPAGH